MPSLTTIALHRAMALMQRCYKNEQGLTGVEYAIMLVFLAMVIAVGAFVLGNNVSNLFSNAGGSLGSAQLPPLP